MFASVICLSTPRTVPAPLAHLANRVSANTNENNTRYNKTQKSAFLQYKDSVGKVTNSNSIFLN